MNTGCLYETRLTEAVRPDMIGKTGLVFVDFDHTLFGCNSTEMFIGSCKPSAVVALIDFLIRVCIPWKLTRIKSWFRIRDYVCVVTILIFTPWNAMRWKRIAPSLFSKYENHGLAELLRMAPKKRVVIVSFGLNFIIKALVAESDFAAVLLLATPMSPKLTLFLRGKLFHVQRFFDSDVITTSTFITDSIDDGDLLAEVETPALIEPYGNTYRAAQRLYIPFRYTVSAKYPFFYTFDQFLLVDLPVALIAVSGSILAFLHNLVVVPFFLIALMCVYEIGYFENDMKAAKLERAPALSGKEGAFAHYPIRITAWVWSLVLSAVGVLIAIRIGAMNQSSALGIYCIWNAILAIIRLVFFFYNSISVSARIYVYPFLQILKYGAVLVVFTPTIAGVTLVLAQVLTMYMIYVVYRLNGDRQATQREQVRLIIFVLVIAAFIAHRSYDLSAETFSLFMATAWLIFRIARTALVKVYKSRRRQIALN